MGEWPVSGLCGGPFWLGARLEVRALVRFLPHPRTWQPFFFDRHRCRAYADAARYYDAADEAAQAQLGASRALHHTQPPGLPHRRPSMRA